MLELIPVRRSARRSLSDTTFVRQVPSYMRRGFAGAERDFNPFGLGELDSEHSVRELQQMLRKVGHCETGRVDGTYGAMTRQALGRFALQLASTSGSPSAVYVAGVDWLGTDGASTIRMNAELWTKLAAQAAGQTDGCAASGGGGGGGSTSPEPSPDADSGYDSGGGMMSSPWTWLGVAALAAVGYYAYTESRSKQGFMMLSPSRL